MNYNLTSIQIDSLKQEGLSIIDKRGLPFDKNEERYFHYINAILLDDYYELLDCCEDLSSDERKQSIEIFKINMGIV